MPGDSLKPINWLSQNMIADYKVEIVKKDNLLWKVHTLGNLDPGTFGLKIKTNTTGGLLLINSLPYEKDEVQCDAEMDSFPPEGTNARWVNNHFHGFWGSANQDNVFACAKPDQKYQYRYTIDPIHPTGQGICHSHNFSSSLVLEQTSVFPVLIYDPEKPDYPLNPRKYQEEFLFLQAAYLQPCDGTEPINDNCDYQYNDGQTTPNKFYLTNGQMSPIASYPTDKMIIFRISWFGNANNLQFAIVDDMDQRVNFRLLSLDAIPIRSGETPENTDFAIMDNYSVAHTQRFDIGVIFEKPRQYMMVDLQNQGTDNAPPPFLYINAVEKKHPLLDQKPIDSGPTEDVVYNHKMTLYDLKLDNNTWVKTVNKMFKNIPNIIAYRELTFSGIAINNQQFMKENLEIIQLTMTENRSEIWELKSNQSTGHSFHIHLMWFLVIAYRDNDSDPWTHVEHSFWADTLSFTHSSFLIWLFPFANLKQPRTLRATGMAMAHCHNGFHVDDMMSISMFIGNRPPSGVPNDGPDSLGPRPMPPEVLAIVEQEINGDNSLQGNNDIPSQNSEKEHDHNNHNKHNNKYKNMSHGHTHKGKKCGCK